MEKRANIYFIMSFLANFLELLIAIKYCWNTERVSEVRLLTLDLMERPKDFIMAIKPYSYPVVSTLLSVVVDELRERTTMWCNKPLL